MSTIKVNHDKTFRQFPTIQYFHHEFSQNPNITHKNLSILKISNQSTILLYIFIFTTYYKFNIILFIYTIILLHIIPDLNL